MRAEGSDEGDDGDDTGVEGMRGEWRWRREWRVRSRLRLRERGGYLVSREREGVFGTTEVGDRVIEVS